jgi:hypothetical protein
MWIIHDGYFFAFLFGVIVTNGVHMYLNTNQIRRNSETIRKGLEASRAAEKTTVSLSVDNNEIIRQFVVAHDAAFREDRSRIFGGHIEPSQRVK